MRWNWDAPLIISPHSNTRLYFGAQRLYRSGDRGDSWKPVSPDLTRALDRNKLPLMGKIWPVDAVQKNVSTALYDNISSVAESPKQEGLLYVGTDDGLVQVSEDGGRNWEPRNKGICARFMPPDQQYPEWGQCVHKVVFHPSNPNRMFLQHHWGVYRSDDAGDSWQDIGRGLPSDFGFAMEMDPNDADTVYIIPIESDEFRCTPDGKLCVYRSKNGGESWEPLTNGLPQEDALETILRDNLDADANDPTGLYFGTRSGKVYGSNNGGDSWTLIKDGLPPITCVKTATVN